MANGEGQGTRARIDAYPVEFSGSAGEYFRVWIVNVLLTVVTLGLYTPFARRRTARWFYGHTVVAGTPLEFTAQQRKMVFGFLLLVGLYIALEIASRTGQDTVASVMVLAAAALAPYFWGSAMRFRLNATRWRGVRLQFAAKWGEVYRAFWPVFAIAAVWIAAFAVIALFAGPQEGAPRRRLAPGNVAPVLGTLLLAVVLSLVCLIRLEFNTKSLLVRRGRIGGQAGRWKPVFGDFVRIWLATLGVFIGGVLVVALAGAALVGGSVAFLQRAKAPGLGAILFFITFGFAAIFLLFLASGPARAYREARMFRMVWSNIGVSQVARFRCDLRVGRYVLLRVRNILLTLLTLGFFRPFALVSEYRMKSESVTLHVKGSLDQLAGQLAREEEGLGDAIAAAAGLDLVG
jgi:uncharacterized membrane protein YjgN (DUF898 family)